MSMIMIFPLIISILFISLNHPMLMVASIILQTMLLCILLWMLNSTSWFSFILFLVFLGGLLVLFVYICSLASNEYFKTSINFKITLMMVLSIFFFSSMNMMTQEMNSNVYIFKMMTMSSYQPVLISMFYLLLTLIVVVKITNNKSTPLRMTKN
uniref:NADH-ubiquinone oxidoreductase chain 6 n=1 Tax=Ptenothrix huangshanensis TaxID=2583244 RepID=A0A6H0EX36_9HEXA|nr:NADH dehydrogenase subunit 6 [Ptenothrix huangshanensis]